MTKAKEKKVTKTSDKTAKLVSSKLVVCDDKEQRIEYTYSDGTKSYSLV